MLKQGEPVVRSRIAGASWDARRKASRQPPAATMPADPTPPQDMMAEASTERAFAVRFGERSPQIDCVVCVVPQQYDYTWKVNFVATKRARQIAAPGILTWDPLGKTLTWTTYADFETMAGRLDPAIAISNFILIAVMEIMKVTSEMLESASSPNVILIGGVIPILIAMWLFYTMLWFALKFAFLFVFLPGIIIGGVVILFRGTRLKRLEKALVAHAYAAVADFKPPSPSSPWLGY